MLASDQSLNQDEVFDILSSARRRYAISILNRRDEPIELTALAEEIAALEGDTTVEELDKQQRKRVYVSLYQTHVPKLADAGIVNYDSEAGTVELAGGASEIDTYLTQRSESADWGRYYLSFSLAVGGLLVLAVTDVAFFTQVPDLLIAGVAVVGFGLLALAQYVSERDGKRPPPELSE
jgi:hypothetical protein